MKHILSLLMLFLLVVQHLMLKKQTAKTKVQSKIESYETEKTLDDIKWYDGEQKGIQLIQISIPQNIINQYQNFVINELDLV